MSVVAEGIKEARERKRRADAGTIRVQPRDRAALAWMIDMRGISEPDLAVLLARLDGRREPLALKTARSVVDRWQAAGLAEAQRILVGEPRVITPTTKAAVLLGLARVGRDGRPDALSPIAWTQIKHVMACARVRLSLEDTSDLTASNGAWISDRVLRGEGTDGPTGVAGRVTQRHLPDAVMTLPGVPGPEGEPLRVAVEVELTAKSPAVLDEIVKDLGRSLRWDEVRYFTSAEAGRAVEAALARAKPGKNPIRVYPIPSFGI
jgi:hypothetical protein